jgi:hypothetical protein
MMNESVTCCESETTHDQTFRPGRDGFNCGRIIKCSLT